MNGLNSYILKSKDQISCILHFLYHRNEFINETETFVCQIS